MACEEAPSRARKDIRVNDLLVSTVRPNLNAVAQVTAELDGQIASTGFAVLRPDPKRIHPRYLFFRVITDAFISDMVAQAKGAGYPAVSDRIVSNHKLPLPPLSEQHLIVEILDQADTLRRQRREADELSKRILPALFQEMFGDPMGWSSDFTIQDTVSDVRKTNPQLSPDQAFSYLDIGSIDSEGGTVLKAKVVSGADAPSRARQLIASGDVIISTVRPYLKANAVVPADLENPIASTGFCVLRPKTQRLSRVLWGMSRLDWFSGRLMAVAKGASYPAVSDQDVMSLPFPLNPEDPKFEDLSAQIERILQFTGYQSTSATKLETLFQTLLHRAFDGSLTAKWREGQGKELLQEMEHHSKR